MVGGIRDEAQVERAVARAVERFGGIDVCVNNASAINLSGTEALEIKRYDLRSHRSSPQSIAFWGQEEQWFKENRDRLAELGIP